MTAENFGYRVPNWLREPPRNPWVETRPARAQDGAAWRALGLRGFSADPKVLDVPGAAINSKPHFDARRCDVQTGDDADPAVSGKRGRVVDRRGRPNLTNSFAELGDAASGRGRGRELLSHE